MSNMSDRQTNGSNSAKATAANNHMQLVPCHPTHLRKFPCSARVVFGSLRVYQYNYNKSQSAFTGFERNRDVLPLHFYNALLPEAPEPLNPYPTRLRLTRPLRDYLCEPSLESGGYEAIWPGGRQTRVWSRLERMGSQLTRYPCNR